MDDAKAITTLFLNETGRMMDPSRLLLRLEQYRVYVAEEQGMLRGFLLSSRFAPDILELNTISM